ncbi:MAG: 2-oxoacid:ferredoxin oxidoreductase subunit beta, partial [Ignavibacteriales bacterium CG18_big_fil_WC_8_21_14_2_50_31_20]
VFRQILKPTYDESVVAQINDVTAKKGKGDLETLLFSGNTWEVE